MLMNQGVSKEIKILYKEDLCREDVKNCIRTIKEKNEMLGVCLEQYMKSDGGKGIRHDVLNYFCENINSISINQDVIYNFVSLLEKTDMHPGWYEWINEYCKQNVSFSMDDFMTLLQEAMDKNIPLHKVKDIFAAGKDDMFSIYESIEKYEEKWLDEETNTEEENLSYQFLDSQGKSEVIDKYREKDIDYTGMVGDLLSVVTERKGDMQGLVPVQEHLNGYATSLQNFVNDITSYSGRIVNEWQKDREENERLKSLYRMQQKLLRSQQDKIFEMREEIFRLKGIIQDYEKAELHRAAMNRKIDELHSLSGQDSFHGGFGSDKY